MRSPNGTGVVHVLLALLLRLLTIGQCYKRPHPIELTIDSGAIRGELLEIDAYQFTAFKGIPYAAPPVGALRFQVRAIFLGYFMRYSDSNVTAL